VSKSAEDTHFILEYEANDVCGNWTAPRANRLMLLFIAEISLKIRTLYS